MLEKAYNNLNQLNVVLDTKNYYLHFMFYNKSTAFCYFNSDYKTFLKRRIVLQKTSVATLAKEIGNIDDFNIISCC